MSEERTNGGWFCYGRCRDWTELNMDREENVCGRCHQRTVEFLPAAGSLQAGKFRVERQAREEAKKPKFRYRNGRMVTVEEGREKFEQMRKAVNHEKHELHEREEE